MRMPAGRSRIRQRNSSSQTTCSGCFCARYWNRAANSPPCGIVPGFLNELDELHLGGKSPVIRTAQIAKRQPNAGMEQRMIGNVSIGVRRLSTRKLCTIGSVYGGKIRPRNLRVRVHVVGNGPAIHRHVQSSLRIVSELYSHRGQRWQANSPTTNHSTRIPRNIIGHSQWLV